MIKFNQLTQMVISDGKGGYMIKDLPPQEDVVLEEHETQEYEPTPKALTSEEKVDLHVNKLVTLEETIDVIFGGAV